MKSQSNLFSTCKLAVAIAALTGGMSALAANDMNEGNDSAIDRDSTQWESKVNRDTDARDDSSDANREYNYQTSDESNRDNQKNTNNVSAEADKPNAVFFAFDSAELDSQAKEKLDKIKNKLKEGKIEDAEITISAYTDSTGDKDYNKDLAERRAKSVKEYLGLEESEVETIEVEAHGESDSLADNDTPQGRQENRRVEINFDGVEELEQYTMN